MGAGDAGHNIQSMNLGAQFGAKMAALMRGDFVYLWENVWPIFWPMLAGGIPTAIVVWFVLYIALKGGIVAYHDRRRRLQEPPRRSDNLENGS